MSIYLDKISFVFANIICHYFSPLLFSQGSEEKSPVPLEIDPVFVRSFVPRTSFPKLGTRVSFLFRLRLDSLFRAQQVDNAVGEITENLTSANANMEDAVSGA